MQGQKHYTPKMMYQVHLADMVPADNFYRRLHAALDLSFLYKETARYYGSEGQESIDPVVFFKICLVGYINNIGSDRQLMAYCSNCLDVRLYLHYDIDEALPWHSTISRTRQLYGEEVFLSLFQKILSLCVQHGMVRGKRQAIDSAFIKANASMDSLAEKELLDDVAAYANELNEGSEYKTTANTVTAEKKKQVDRHHKWKEEEYKDQPGGINKTGQTNKEQSTDEHGNLIRPKFLSNHTHYSPTDPDARISVKPGKARQLNYFGQIAVDDAHHVITGAVADYASKRDSQCLPNILNQTLENLTQNHIHAEQICADTAYSSGESLQYLQDIGVDAYIPNFGQYKPHREGFIYNKTLDQYECQRGHRAILPFRSLHTDKNGYTKRIYRSTNEKCKNCPLRSTCIGKSDFKKLDDSIYKPLYDKMHQKMQTSYAKKVTRIRSRTVEPVLGTLINFTNMRRVNTRGIAQATKHVLMAALTYNLKKYMKFMAKQIKNPAKALEVREALSFCKTLLHKLISAPVPTPNVQTIKCSFNR